MAASVGIAQELGISSAISQLAEIIGRPAWGVRRTYGSSFFLEIGKPRPPSGHNFIRGEWHFLFQVCHWRIDSKEAVLVGSEDKQATIDAAFNNFELGDITSIDIAPISRDLTLRFSSGLTLRTFTASGASDWGQWDLFMPDDRVLSTNSAGKAAIMNSDEQSPWQDSDENDGERQ